jgi:hypothetical protein
MNEVFVISSEMGDEYKLQFTTDSSGIIADSLLAELNSEGIEVIEVGLGRINGINVTSPRMLYEIESRIAEVLEKHPNAVLSFFCDFISMVPKMRKKMSVQEYRSRIFSAMFKHYVFLNRQDGYRNKVVKIEGYAEDYYFHVIYHERHQRYADMIAEGHQKDFGKPE